MRELIIECIRMQVEPEELRSRFQLKENELCTLSDADLLDIYDSAMYAG